MTQRLATSGNCCCPKLEGLKEVYQSPEVEITEWKLETHCICTEEIRTMERTQPLGKMALYAKRKGKSPNVFSFHRCAPLVKPSKKPADRRHWEIQLSGMSHPVELSRGGKGHGTYLVSTGQGQTQHMFTYTHMHITWFQHQHVPLCIWSMKQCDINEVSYLQNNLLSKFTWPYNSRDSSFSLAKVQLRRRKGRRETECLTMC